MKNANFADRYLEKIVLVVALLAAAGGVYYFIVASPNQVEVGGRTLAPDEVSDVLSEKAQQLRASIDQEHDMPDFVLPDFVSIIADREAWRPAPRAEYDGITDGIGGPESGSLQDLKPYDLPNPPLARNPTARQGAAVLRLTGQDDVDQPLLRLIEAEDQPQPYDFRYATVGATFDLEEWRQRLQAGDNPVRRNWWQDSLEDITGVYLERQELLDPARDEWSEPERIDPLRQGDAIEADFNTADFSNQDIENALAAIRNDQRFYRRPPFVSVQRDFLVQSPFTQARSVDDERELADLFDDIESIDGRLENYRRQLERAPSGERRNALQDRIANEQTDRNEIGQQINELVGMPLFGQTEVMDRPQPRFDDDFNQPRRPGVGGRNGEFTPPQFPGPDGRAAPRTPIRRPAIDRPARPGFDADLDEPASEQPEDNPDEIKVWAHDLTVQPGRTYRYRVVVTVRNPLFRKTRVAPQQKEENYDRLTLGPAQAELTATANPDSETAEGVWSDPVTIDPELFYFLLRGQTRTALVEVWRVFDGRWRNAEFQVSPGDPIGGVAQLDIEGETIALPMQADDIAVDIVSSAGGGLGGGNSELIVAAPDGGQMASRSAGSGRQTIDRVRLLNQNRINDLLQERASGENRLSQRP